LTSNKTPLAKCAVLKLDDLRVIAANTKVAVISVTKSWLDALVTGSESYITDYSILLRNKNHDGEE